MTKLITKLPLFLIVAVARGFLPQAWLPAKKGSSALFSAVPPTATTTGTITTDNVSGIELLNLSGESVVLSDVLLSSANNQEPVILSCLSHFGDFNAWELTQQYQAAVTTSTLEEAKVVLVGIGGLEAAQKFADDLGLSVSSPQITLLADETGAVTDALGCYKGWLAIDKAHAEKWPAADVNPYIKLFGMIFGFGSPGTIPKVLYGYTGDQDNGAESRKWVVDSLLQGSQKGRWPQLTDKAFEGIPSGSGLRPFELATLRAQTGIHIVLNWGKLGPKDGDLFTRMGGTFIFDSEGICKYEYYDQGILTYANVQEICKQANALAAPATAASTTIVS